MTGRTVWLGSPEAAGHLEVSRLSEANRAVWQGLGSPRRRLDWASSRALLQFAQPADGLATCLTHSRGFSGLAVMPAGCSAGIDIEWMRPRDFVGISRFAFSAAESRKLQSLGTPAAVESHFYTLWTLKEAFAKALGLGLLEALATCRFEGEAGTLNPVVPTGRPWSALVFAPRPQLRLAIVTLGAGAGAGAGVGAGGSPIACHEWPPALAVEWPVVLRLDGPSVAMPAFESRNPVAP